MLLVQVSTTLRHSRRRAVGAALAIAPASCLLSYSVDDLNGAILSPRSEAGADGAVDEQAAAYDTPDGGDGGSPSVEPDGAPGFKRVFVTSDVWDGLFGGVDGADARCGTVAKRAGLTGRWIAWISDSTHDAIERIEYDGSYHLLDGREIVANKEQLASGKLINPLNLFETGKPNTDSTVVVWTGTLPTGRRAAYCDDWSTNAGYIYGTGGSLDQQSEAWTKNGGPAPWAPNWACSGQAHLYCFEL
jgi:hypothetical protein